MIVTACDICRKLMDSGCLYRAARASNRVVAFSKDVSSAGSQGSHLCSRECALTFFERWMADDLPELPKVEPVVLPPATATRPHTVTGIREPTPQEIADQQGALAAVLGGRY